MQYLRSEIFYPLVSILIPGALTACPWLVVLYLKFDQVKDIYTKNETISHWVLLGVVVFFGIIVRDLGLQIEHRIFDEWLKKKHSRQEENWWAYLLNEKTNATIFDYITTKVVHLEFEIGSAIALVSALVPSIIILSHYDVACWVYLVDIILLIALIAYLTHEACMTCSLLSESRARLLGKEWPPKRFHGTITLDPSRVGLEASKVADDVISHLSAIVGATVTVTLDIKADIPTGAPDQVVRTVTENCRTLKFDTQGFKKE